MRKELAHRCVELTQEMLERFWQLDCEYILSLATDDVMWVAPEQERYMRGIDAMRADLFANRKELVPCHMSSAEFTIVLNCGNACSIMGRYLVATDEGAPYFLSVQQRCQATWELIDGQPRLRAIYVSHPRGELAVAKGETFANAMGKMSMRYLEAHASAQGDGHRLVFSDEAGDVHFVREYEVLALVAHGKRCDIHTVEGVSRSKLGLSEMRAKLRGRFVEVHRGIVVNVRHVSVVRPYEVEMTDGSLFPIPKPRYVAVRSELMRAHG